ncbi:MAG: Rnf-Nqr domain containing protein [Spirochaetaceae bacterium]|nr:Rnf-Nqr domain containing protein [Spirochaetaceae bacterium]
MSYRGSSFAPNPALGWAFGTLAVTIACDALPDGLILGFGVFLCNVLLYAAIKPVRALLSDRLALPVAAAILAALASLYGSAIRAFAPTTALGLGIYLPLLAVNSLGLHTIRRCAFAATIETRKAASRFATIMRESAGTFFVCVLVGALREMLGSGTLTFPALDSEVLRIAIASAPPFGIFSTPAGAFMLLGTMAAIYRAALRGSGRRTP